MTRELFREQGYTRTVQATVLSVAANEVCLDETIFYPRGGGQPGDTGRLIRPGVGVVEVVDTRKDPDSGCIYHQTDEGSALPEPGERVVLELDWDRRYRHMRMHTCMHLLCAVVPAPVTGGAIKEGSARLDFDLPDPPDKQAIEESLNRLIAEDHPLRTTWITDAELEASPELVRTMSVQPPRGTGGVRLVEIEGVDLQPCGGTHVGNTGEIGRVRVKKIEKKGKQNRRIIVEFDDGTSLAEIKK